MLFPRTNKVPQGTPEDEIESNAKLLEELVSRTDWRVLTHAYFYCLGILLVTVFAFIVVIRGALKIF